MVHCCPLAFRLSVIQLSGTLQSHLALHTPHGVLTSKWLHHKQRRAWIPEAELWPFGREAETEREAPIETEVAAGKARCYTRAYYHLQRKSTATGKQPDSRRRTSLWLTWGSQRPKLGARVHPPRLAHVYWNLPMASQSKAVPYLKSSGSTQWGIRSSGTALSSCLSSSWWPERHCER